MRRGVLRRIWRLLAAVYAVVGVVKAGAHPSHPLEPVDYPVVAGFENFFIQEDSESYLAQGGELLLSELNCVGCHAPKADVLRARIPGKEGPMLGGVGSRLRPRDIRMMVRNPRQVKRGTTMPSVFAGPDRDPEVIEALTHFLAAQTAEAKVYPEGDAERGQEVYHAVGCVACHSTEEGYRPKNFPEGMEPEMAGFPSVPLALCYLYEEGFLASFLHRPLATHRSGRMPEMKLSEEEAADIARYLKAGFAEADADGVEEFVIDGKLVERGRGLFKEKRCTACHDAGGEAGLGGEERRGKPLEELDPSGEQGCLAESPQAGGVPFYYLDFVQKEAIKVALKRMKGADGERALTAGEEVDRTMTRLNCYACHSREGKGGPEIARSVFFGVTDPAAMPMGDFASIPPSLSLVGRKLTRGWMEKVLKSGSGDVRPHMSVRMPVFGVENVGRLGEAFAAVDVRNPPMEMDTSGLLQHQRSDYGRDLLGVDGLGCVTCHGFKEAKAIGAPAINLTHTVERLQPGYFKELLLDPQKMQPGTMMPPIFTGRENAEEEIEQIWTYLTEIEGQRLPDGQGRTEDLELKPDKEPIVFRTFLEGAGMQAIAVGYPAGVHAAFDAFEVRWAIAWRGRFVDAVSTWEERKARPATPLGEEVLEFPLHVSFARLSGPDVPWPEKTGRAAGVKFQGYRLDDDGAPVFLYSLGDIRIKDRMKPTEAGSTLKRRVRVWGEANDLYFRGLGEGAKVRLVQFRDGEAVIEEVLKW